MYSLLHHNTFGIDALCEDFREYSRTEQLCALLSEMHERKWLHIGGGSNLLFTTNYNGTILHSAIKCHDIIKQDEKYVWLRVGAGEIWDDFVAWCIINGFYGLENLSLIPGEVGASAVQNIGAYGVEVEQFIDNVETIEVATGKQRIFTHDECNYIYRNSFFKQRGKGKYIVTHVIFRLSKSFSPDLEYGAVKRLLCERNISPHNLTSQLLRDLIIYIRRKKLPEVNTIGSAGSFFTNPIINENDFKNLLKHFPQIPHYCMPQGIKIPAGWLIEQCGWKGKRLGNAGVWEKQALVLVNLGGATGNEIALLSDKIRIDVKETFGIDIVPEVNFINENGFMTI